VVAETAKTFVLQPQLQLQTTILNHVTKGPNGKLIIHLSNGYPKSLRVFLVKLGECAFNSFLVQIMRTMLKFAWNLEEYNEDKVVSSNNQLSSRDYCIS
jgi:hypothetical protein